MSVTPLNNPSAWEHAAYSNVSELGPLKQAEVRISSFSSAEFRG
jgi:hypothetical protein